MTNALLFEACAILGVVVFLSTPLAWSRGAQVGMGALSGASGLTLAWTLAYVAKSPERVAWLADHEWLAWCAVALWVLCLLGGSLVTITSWTRRKVA